MKFNNVRDEDISYTAKNAEYMILALVCVFIYSVPLGFLAMILVEPITTAIDNVMGENTDAH